MESMIIVKTNQTQLHVVEFRAPGQALKLSIMNIRDSSIWKALQCCVIFHEYAHTKLGLNRRVPRNKKKSCSALVATADTNKMQRGLRGKFQEKSSISQLLWPCLQNRLMQKKCKNTLEYNPINDYPYPCECRET